MGGEQVSERGPSAEPRAWLTVMARIGSLEFSVSKDKYDCVHYTVAATRTEADDDCDYTNSVDVHRKEFLAMLEVAKAGAGK